LNHKIFFILNIIPMFVLFLPQVANAQMGQMCWPVKTCIVTNVSQGGETKFCWERMECVNYPVGVTFIPSSSFPNSVSTPSGGNSTIASIEEEAKKRFCSEKIADIPRVVAQCKTDAHSDYSYNLGAVCQGQTSKTITGSISAWIFGGTRSTTTSCTLLERAKRDAAISKCDSDAENVRRALDKQCKG
jgi:hypothetical protein